MIPIDIKKVIRLFLGFSTFLCITSIIGLHLRAGHQLLFSLFIIILFGLIVRNIWLTLFIWLSAFLFTLARFEVGQVYMTNIFYGAILYYITKLVFDKKHIDWFIKIVLWVVVANIAYGIIQLFSFDFIYTYSETFQFTQILNTPSPNGFMGNSAMTADLYCFAIPLMATRSSKSIWLSFVLLIPIFLLHSTTALFTAIVLYMFLLWFKVNKKIWFTILGVLMLLGTVHIVTGEMPGVERFPVWKEALNDCNVHPIKGWGMDSFRKFTSAKMHIYMSNAGCGSQWDNPHNLYISLLYEFGFLSLILLGGYIRQLIIWFRNAMKEPNTLALAGFILGFFIVSLGNFPIFVARLAIIIIIVLGLYEVQTRGSNG